MGIKKKSLGKESEALSIRTIVGILNFLMFAAINNSINIPTNSLMYLTYESEEWIQKIRNDGVKNSQAILNNKSLHYFIQEIMRIRHSVNIGVSRKMTKDYVLDGIQLKKGDGINIPIWAFHEFDCWKNSDKFDPMRWAQSLSSNEKQAYLPFYGGKRGCVG